MRVETMSPAACRKARGILKEAVIERCSHPGGSPYWLTVREAARLCGVRQDDVELIAADTLIGGEGWVDLVGPMSARTGDIQLEWVSL